MKKQKCLVLTETQSASMIETDINNNLNEGWIVAHIISQTVSTGSNYSKSGSVIVIFEKSE